MVAMIRKWLLDIVKQAIREDRESTAPAPIYGRESLGDLLVQANKTMQTLGEIKSEPLSFEQMQDAAIQQQIAYLKKHKPFEE